jgi:hypothetical protein
VTVQASLAKEVVIWKRGVLVLPPIIHDTVACMQARARGPAARAPARITSGHLQTPDTYPIHPHPSLIACEPARAPSWAPAKAT